MEEKDKKAALYLYIVEVGQCILAAEMIRIDERLIKYGHLQTRKISYNAFHAAVTECVANTQRLCSIASDLDIRDNVSNTLTEYKEEISFLNMSFRPWYLKMILHPSLAHSFFSLKDSVKTILETLKRKDQENKFIAV